MSQQQIRPHHRHRTNNTNNSSSHPSQQLPAVHVVHSSIPNQSSQLSSSSSSSSDSFSPAISSIVSTGRVLLSFIDTCVPSLTHVSNIFLTISSYCFSLFLVISLWLQQLKLGQRKIHDGLSPSTFIILLISCCCFIIETFVGEHVNYLNNPHFHSYHLPLLIGSIAAALQCLWIIGKIQQYKKENTL